MRKHTQIFQLLKIESEAWNLRRNLFLRTKTNAPSFPLIYDFGHAIAMSAMSHLNWALDAELGLDIGLGP